jgi:hypothetical protein
MNYTVELQPTHLQPTKKDLERAEAWRSKSDAQKNAQVNAIKDATKALTRGVAIALKDHFSNHYTERLLSVARQYGASEELISKYQETVEFIYSDWSRQFQEEQNRKRKEIYSKIAPGLARPNEINGGKSVKIGRNQGYISIEFGQDNFYYNACYFYYTTRAGNDKSKFLGRTYSQSYDLKYDEWLVNIINQNKIKSV